jgi:hypothetical protein
LWPRNRVEAAAFALWIVSDIGGVGCSDVWDYCSPRVQEKILTS